METEYRVHEARYRGYDITYDDLGADIWSGQEYITTEYSRVAPLAAAKRVIDEWMNAR